MQSSNLPVSGAATDVTEYSVLPFQLTQLTTSTTARSLGPILDGVFLQHSAPQGNLTTEHKPAHLGAGRSGPVDSTPGQTWP